MTTRTLTKITAGILALSVWPTPHVEAGEALQPTAPTQIETASTTIDTATVKQWSAPYRNWHYHSDHVIPEKPNIKGFETVHMTDVPTVFQLPDDAKWYMTFIGFDGKGYQSFIADSDDLVHWT